MTVDQGSSVSGEPILSIRNLVKKFGGLTAVNDVSLDIMPGEVVGLVGDNGAGKSTLIKCVSGVHHPDGGRIFFEGMETHFSRPIDAREAGIETIYQDLALAGNLDVSANIFLGREVKKRYLFGVVNTLDEKHMLSESNGILDNLGIHIPQMQKEIEKLSGGQRQAVAIARAIYWNARMMIMDEPTNNLGVPVIFISHTLPDVFAATDRIIVMHRGRKVAEMPTSSTNTTEVVEYMVGARQQDGGTQAQVTSTV